MKVIFPLPCGNATVVFRVEVRPGGGLRLRSSGRTYGDPGFYFLVEDRAGTMWKHYLRSFREEIAFTEEVDGTLRARHRMTLWHLPVYEMDYTITEKREAAAA